MPSVHDPEMRHGHKSAHKRFDGHKAQVAVDVEGQWITAVAVLAGNAADHDGALALVAAAEQDCAAEVAETVADCAFGDGATRQAFAAAGRRLVAKVAVTRNADCFPKTAFRIDLTGTSCVCPAGQQGVARYSKEGTLRGFRFAAATCSACPLRARCVRGSAGRSIAVHPQEALLQEARALQQSPAFAPYKRDRQVVEHRLARLVQLGIRQARYVGRAKTLFQLLMAATVANLTLLAGLGAAGKGQPEPTSPINVALAALAALLIITAASLGPQQPLRSRLASTSDLDRARQPARRGFAKMALSRPHF